VLSGFAKATAPAMSVHHQRNRLAPEIPTSRSLAKRGDDHGLACKFARRHESLQQISPGNAPDAIGIDREIGIILRLPGRFHSGKHR